MWCMFFVFFSSRRRHTRCALVTGVQTCALPISFQAVDRWEYDGSPPFKAAQQFATELAAVEDVKLKGLPAERQEAARRDSAGVRAAYGLHIAQRAQNARVEALHEKREERTSVV